MERHEKGIAIFWFRRDLRLKDNVGLHKALDSGIPVLPIFIFDTDITSELPADDPRINFIHENLCNIHHELTKHQSGLYCLNGDVETVFNNLIAEFPVSAVYTNEDYEPYATMRNTKINNLLTQKNIPFFQFKDQVIFAKSEVVKQDGRPYTVYTPYKNKWIEKLSGMNVSDHPVNRWSSYIKTDLELPSLKDLGFMPSSIKVQPYRIESLDDYAETRNFPGLDKTSKLSPHLRFGTVSIRALVSKLRSNSTFLNELIWREFFMQILWNFPNVVTDNFKSKYDNIRWRNNGDEFDKWKGGQTGYPVVDAGMRELNKTGYMHNRVRMITAGFLCKHLLIDWRWGESYFAEKLLDYELSSNNGNWQWAAGTGCDAAPYFRIFNPETQVKKFDPDLTYVKKWIPEIDSSEYPKPIIEHRFARERALNAYKIGLFQMERTTKNN